MFGINLTLEKKRGLTYTNRHSKEKIYTYLEPIGGLDLCGIKVFGVRTPELRTNDSLILDLFGVSMIYVMLDHSKIFVFSNVK